MQTDLAQARGEAAGLESRLKLRAQVVNEATGEASRWCRFN